MVKVCRGVKKDWWPRRINDFEGLSTTYLDENFKKIDFGLTGGIGIKVNRFTIDLIYKLGLNNIAEDGDNDFLETNVKNRSLNLNLTYWIK